MALMKLFKTKNRYEKTFIDSESAKKQYLNFIHRYTENKRLHATMRNNVLSVNIKSRCFSEKWVLKRGQFTVIFS